MAFHISRRTEQWGFSAQARLTAERNLVSGNRKVSPFNARISARLSQAPDRFFRGGVQSYYDAIDLCDQIRAGNHPGLNAGARVDFLGYSAGGYLALALLMADAGGRFSDSRAALFASGASMDGMRPGSVFIMDTESTDRLTAYMERRRYPDIEVEAGLQPLLEEPAHWMETIFFHGPGLSERLRYLGPRLTGVAGPGDRVITEEGMRKNLYPVTINSLDLGIHEFPFNLPDPLIETYDRRQPETRALLNDIHHGHRIAERYRDTFDAFIRIVSGALSS
jgi:hypothetical protein